MTAVQENVATGIEERKNGSLLVVSPARRPDATGAPAPETRMSAIMARGAPRIMLDCIRMTVVRSARARPRRGGKSFISVPGPEHQQARNMDELLSIIDIDETCDAALEAFA